MSDISFSRKNVLSGLVWRFAERCGAQGVTLVVSIVLARILSPNDFGNVALITVFINILNVFVDGGFGNALIQKKDSDELDFSSVFYCNIVLCSLLYGLIFLVSPLIADFYNSPSLIPLIRVLSITVIISGLKNVQQAYVSKYLLFRKFFFATLGGTIFAAVLGISAAYLGFGTWAIVIQQLSNVFIDTIILWITVKWRPVKKFSLVRLRNLFGYGWKLLISSLLMTIYSELWNLLIGKFYSSSELAFYNQGQKFPSVIVTNINVSIDSVMLPTMSSVQDNLSNVKKIVRRAMRTSIYIMSPLMIGLAVIAEPLVRLLLTEKWLPSVFFLRVFCVIFLFYPVHTANLNAIKAIGKSNTILTLQIIKIAFGLFVLLVTMKFGTHVIAVGSLATTAFSLIANTTPNKKLLNYGYMEQIKDILPSIILALLMGIIIYPLCFLPILDVYILLIQILVGGTIYVLFSKLFRIEAYQYLLDMIKSKKVRK